MNGILKLKTPLEVVNGDGKKVSYTQLEYNPLEITALQFSEACSRSSALNKNKQLSISLRQTDNALHLYLGMMAVIACNPHIDVTDLERGVKGYDALELADIGMVFTYRKWAEPSEENNSEKPSETTADTSEQASEKSGK